MSSTPAAVEAAASRGGCWPASNVDAEAAEAATAAAEADGENPSPRACIRGSTSRTVTCTCDFARNQSTAGTIPSAPCKHDVHGY